MTVNELVSQLAQFPGDMNALIDSEGNIDDILVSHCFVGEPGKDIEAVIISAASAE